MNITPELVDKLANLSKLQFNAAEKEAITADLEQMITFVEKLNELDTTGIEPLQHLCANENLLREDVVQPSLPANIALQNAPQKQEPYFMVPKMIKK